MKKSTERKRINRMSFDSRMLFNHGLISAATVDKINMMLIAAKKKL